MGITGKEGEQLSTSLSTLSCLEAVQSSEVILQPLFLHACQSQSPQLFLLRHPCHQLFCPLLDTFKDLHIFLKLRPRTADSSQGDTAPMLSTAGWSPFLTGCWCSVWCTPGWVCPPACPGWYCCLVLSLLLTSTHRSLTAVLLCSHSSPSLYLWPALLHFKCRSQHFGLLNFMPLIISQCSSLSRPLCKPLVPQESQLHFPIWYHGALRNC